MGKAVTATGLVGAFMAVIGGLIAILCLFFGYIPGVVGGGIAVLVGVMLRTKT